MYSTPALTQALRNHRYTGLVHAQHAAAQMRLLSTASRARARQQSPRGCTYRYHTPPNPYPYLCLCSADTARAGQILATSAGVSGLMGSALFALGFGGLCYGTSTSQFERINGALLGLAAATFLVRGAGCGCEGETKYW